jgi:hypothetical protein
MWNFIAGWVWTILYWVAVVVLVLLALAAVYELIKWVARRLWSAITDKIKRLVPQSVIDFVERAGREIEQLRRVLAVVARQLMRALRWPDTAGRRRRVAEDLTAAVQSAEQTRDVESLNKLIQAALGRDGFTRSYALAAIGRLGEQKSEVLIEPARADQAPSAVKPDVMKALKGNLKSRDPFSRERAAQTLYQLGRAAAVEARKDLVRVLRRRGSEGTARYAVLALGELGPLDEDELQALREAVAATDSYAAPEAEKILKRMGGTPPTPPAVPG